MKRIFQSIRNYFKPSYSEPMLETVSGKKTIPDYSDPSVVLTSADPDSPIISSKHKIGRPVEAVSYRKTLNDFIKSEPRAKEGFTAVELYNWMGKTISMSSISKTLYRMRICGEVVSKIKDGDGRIRIWKLTPLD